MFNLTTLSPEALNQWGVAAVILSAVIHLVCHLIHRRRGGKFQPPASSERPDACHRNIHHIDQ